MDLIFEQKFEDIKPTRTVTKPIVKNPSIFLYFSDPFSLDSVSRNLIYLDLPYNIFRSISFINQNLYFLRYIWITFSMFCLKA